MSNYKIIGNLFSNFFKIYLSKYTRFVQKNLQNVNMALKFTKYTLLKLKIFINMKRM